MCFSFLFLNLYSLSLSFLFLFFLSFVCFLLQKDDSGYQSRCEQYYGQLMRLCDPKQVEDHRSSSCGKRPIYRRIDDIVSELQHRRRRKECRLQTSLAWNIPLIAVLVVGSLLLGAATSYLFLNRKRLQQEIRRMKAATTHTGHPETPSYGRHNQFGGYSAINQL